MSAVIAVRKAEVYTLIKSHIHSAVYKGNDRAFIIVYRIFNILYLTAVHKVPETFFKILLLNRRYFLAYMAMEAVGNIFSVGYILNDTVFLSELLYLQTAETLGRCAVKCI